MGQETISDLVRAKEQRAWVVTVCDLSMRIRFLRKSEFEMRKNKVRRK